MDPDDGRVVSSFLRDGILGKPLPVFGDGKQTRSFCFVSDLVAGLRKAISDARLPISSRIYGPTVIPKDLAKIVIHGAHQEWRQIAEVLHELQRRRSIAKKDLLTIRIDPYSL